MFSMGSTIFKDISSKNAKELIDKNSGNSKFMIVDVRTPMEFRMGKIKNSVNIDVYSSDISEKLNSMDKDKVYFVYCQTGARSSMIMNAMHQMGFREVYNLARGISDWSRSGFETVK